MATLRRIVLVVPAILASVTSGMFQGIASEDQKGSRGAKPINVVVRTDKQTYSQREKVKLYVSLENEGDETVYVDGGMLLGGPICGLEVEITNQRGQPVCCRFTDSRFPPPLPREGSLIRLETDRFYGMWVNLDVNQISLKPGKYSVRVLYRSYRERGEVPPRLEDLPPPWRDEPIPSAPIWIKITQ